MPAIPYIVMGKRERQRTGKAKKSESEDDVNSRTPSKTKFVFTDSDGDAEANEDLSLKIVEKAMSRSSSGVRRGREAAVEDIITTELVDGSKKRKKEKKEKKERKEKKKKSEKIEDEAQTAIVVPEGQSTETVNELEVPKLSEQDDVANSDNAVFRRLLRGPRYFDPADNSWGTCYNCGEEGHVSASCKSARRKKPCYVCGSFEHQAKECQKGNNCFICNKSGHRSRDCKEKFKKCSQGSELCLKCGSSGHVMSLCNKDYSLDDLKEIRCYVCKSTGHLCCANYFGTTPSEMSCYKCGQLGHTGLACRRSFNRETGGDSAPSSCFKCGLEGHFARECSTSVKVKKRSYEMSTPKKKSSRSDSYKGYKSAPQEKANVHKKKKLYFDDENIASSSKSKSRGGWTWDDHNEDFPRGKSSDNSRWESKYENGYNNSYNGSGRYDSNYRSPKRFNSPYKTPNSKSSRNGIHQGHSSPWYGNTNNGEYRRYNDRY